MKRLLRRTAAGPFGARDIDSTVVMSDDLFEFARKNPEKDRKARLISARFAAKWGHFSNDTIERAFGVSLSDTKDGKLPSRAKSPLAARIKTLKARSRPK